MKKNDLNLSEMNRLEAMLKREGLDYIREEMEAGDQIIVYKDGKRWWDAILTIYSYGGRQGLLEVMGKPVVEERKDGDRVAGWLTAEEVMKRLGNGGKA